MPQALYRKWRPMGWDEVVGQAHVTRTLRNALKSDRVAHAYLFTGSRGTGKTTTARLVAKAVNCLAPAVADRPDNRCAHCLAVNEGRFLDLIEIDAASNTSVDDVRDLRDKINFAPNQGRYKIYIVDEVHMLSNAAFNALLKTLEEPPAHVIFILATTEVHKVPATITSRCQRFDFRRISVSEIVARLKHVAAEEGLSVEPAALEVVARQATGSMRDAVSLLDQLVTSRDETVTLERAQAVLGTAAGQAVQDLVDALAAADSGAGLTLINTAVDAGADPRQFARQTVDYLRGLLLVRMGNASLVDATHEVRGVMARQANLFEIGRLLRFIRTFNNAALDQRGGWQPQLPLELAFVECSLPEPAGTTAGAVSAPVPRRYSAAGSVQSAVSLTPPMSAATGRSAAPRPGVSANSAQSAESPPPSQNVPPSSQSADSSLTLSDVKNRWGQVKDAARRQHPTVHGLLNSCQPIKVEGEVIVLSTNAGIVVEKLAQAGTQPKVEAALREALGRPCRFKCILASGSESDNVDEDEIAEDGVVATALRDLGGRLANR